MRKKLVLLMLALGATAAASLFTAAPASACRGYIIPCDPPICCSTRNCVCP
jgi:hypothetical protein